VALLGAWKKMDGFTCGNSRGLPAVPSSSFAEGERQKQRIVQTWSYFAFEEMRSDAWKLPPT
jgi:hypothetical protein